MPGARKRRSGARPETPQAQAPANRSTGRSRATGDAVAGIARLSQGRGLDAAGVLALQRLSGNGAVVRVLGSQARSAPPVQAKLVVGAADHPLEREADRVADAVVRRWASPPSGQRGEDDDVVRRVPYPHPDPASAFEADPSLVQRLSARRGSGHALPPPVRRRMEAGFGTDLSDVRIHRDVEAAKLSAGLSARAFTHGTDVYFARGAYDPSSSSGRHLLAHELTHVVQQAGPRSPARRAIRPQRVAEGGLVQRTNGKGKRKASGNRRAREAREELSALKTLPAERKGSKTAGERMRKPQEAEAALTLVSHRQDDKASSATASSPSPEGVLRLQGTVDNQAVVALPPEARRSRLPHDRTAPAVALQRHFFRGLHEHAQVKPPHRHTLPDATNANAYGLAFTDEIERLKASLDAPAATSAGARSSAERLAEIGKILRSQAEVIKAGGGRAGDVAALAGKAEGATATSQRRSEALAKQEMLAKVQREAPSLLRQLEQHALAAARYATEVITTGRTALSKTAPVTKPAASTAKEHDDAKAVHAKLVALRNEAAISDEAAQLAADYVPPADEALRFAERMAAITKAVADAWTAASQRAIEGKEAIEQATKEKKAAEEELKGLEDEATYMVGYLAELGTDAGRWTKVEDSAAIVKEATEHLAAVRQAITEAEEAVRAATENLDQTTETAKRELGEKKETAKQAAAGAEGEPGGATTHLEDLADLRDLAGGPRPLAEMLTHIPNRGTLSTLLTAVGDAVALRWLRSSAIGVARITSLMASFGTSLKAFVTGVGADRVDGLLADLSVEQVHALVTGLGVPPLEAMLRNGITPVRVDGYFTALGGDDLKALLRAIKSANLRALDVEPARLKVVLTETGIELFSKVLAAIEVGPMRTLIVTLAPERVGTLVKDTGLGLKVLTDMTKAPFTPTEIDRYALCVGIPELKAFLVHVPVPTLKSLNITPEKLAAVLGHVSAEEIKELVAVLKANKVAGLVGELEAEQLRGLIDELPGDRLEALRLTGLELKDLLTEYTAAEIQGLAADLGDLALKDLLTKFDAAGIKTYRTTVGIARFKELITAKKLKADALDHYGAAMLKTFVGANVATWNHVAGLPYISATSGQIAGGHDEATFLAYAVTQVGQPPAPRATIDSQTTPANGVSKVTYTLQSGVTGSKTLITDLGTNQATWMDRFNKAIWAAIRSKTFNATGGAYSASAGGWSFAGFYHGGVAVDTIYPV